MIDWFALFYNSLWILGLAVLLTTFSMARWLAGLSERGLRPTLAAPPLRLAVAAGFILFALGLLLAAGHWWHRAGWATVALLSLWEGAVAWQDGFGKTKRS